MDQSRRVLWLRLLDVVIIILALFNLASNVGIFGQPDPDGNRAATDGEVDEIEVLEIVGSINRVTGIPTFLTAVVMVVAGAGIILLQPWAITAGLIALGIDMIFKVINITAEIIIGTPLLAMWLAFVLVIVQVFTFYFLIRQRKPARGETDATV